MAKLGLTVSFLQANAMASVPGLQLGKLQPDCLEGAAHHRLSGARYPEHYLSKPACPVPRAALHTAATARYRMLLVGTQDSRAGPAATPWDTFL